MEIISVTRGDHPSDPWRLSPSIKGMLPFRPACLIDNAKVRHPNTGFCGILWRLVRLWLTKILYDEFHLAAG